MPELLQEDLSAAAIVREALPLLDGGNAARHTMLEGYRRLRLELGEPGVTQRAAAAIFDQLLAAG